MKMPAPSAEFKPLPAGSHLAVCYEVIDFGTQEDTYEGRTNVRRKVWLGWEVPGEQMSDGRNFVIGREYTFSSSKKATFRKHLESWRGVPFKDEDFGEEGKFDIRNLLGQGCMLSVNHNEGGRAVIASVGKLPKGMSIEEATLDSRYLSMEEGAFDPAVFESLSDWMKGRIADSPEYQELTGTSGGEGDDDAPF